MSVTIRERLLATVGGSEQDFASNWNWRSHTPAKRAASNLIEAEQDINAVLAELSAEGATPEQADLWLDRYIAKWAKYQAAGARTSNWMITGPANFPVERNRKRMEVEHKRLEELMAHVSGARSWLRRQGRIAEARQAATASADHASEFFTSERAGVRVVENTTMDRLQLYFDGKPEPETIKALKSRAFKWAPSIGAWQRQLTNNARWAGEFILRGLEAEAAETAAVEA